MCYTETTNDLLISGKIQLLYAVLDSKEKRFYILDRY